MEEAEAPGWGGGKSVPPPPLPGRDSLGVGTGLGDREAGANRPEPQGRRVYRGRLLGAKAASGPEMREDVEPSSAWPGWGEATL